jgi:ketosteroid isomerase-like protein
VVSLRNNFYHFLLFIRDGKVCRLKEYLDTKMAVLTAASAG